MPYRGAVRRLRVLYPGCDTAGRRSSLGALSGLRRPERVDVEVTLASGETVALAARVPYFGSFWYESYADCRTAEHAWIRDAAEELFAFLPTIDGVVFVASSMPPSAGTTQASSRGSCRISSRRGTISRACPSCSS